MILKLPFLFLSILCLSCNNTPQNSIELKAAEEEIPTTTWREKTTKVTPSKALLDYLKTKESALGTTQAVYLFDLSPIERQIPRTFGLMLVEGLQKQALITVSRAEKKVFAYHDFDPKTTQIRSVYSFSSASNPEGVAINLVEQQPTATTPKVVVHEIEVFETGMMKETKTYEDETATFKNRPSQQPFTGDYTAQAKGLQLTLLLRDGEEKDHYAYRLKIRNPETGCNHFFENPNEQPVDQILSIVAETGLGLSFQQENLHLLNLQDATHYSCD